MRNVVCFHNPDEINGYLSNWYLSEFSVDGVKFSSMEQYMMYSKAVCFNDMETAKKILHTEKDVFVSEITEHGCRTQKGTPFNPP